MLIHTVHTAELCIHIHLSWQKPHLKACSVEHLKHYFEGMQPTLNSNLTSNILV